MARTEVGVPPLAFIQLLDGGVLDPEAVTRFRLLLDAEGWSELDLVRRDHQVPVRWFREVYPDLDTDTATRFGLAFAEQAQLTSFGPLSLPLVSAASVAEVFELLAYLPLISGSLRPHFHHASEGLTVGLAGHTGDPVLDCLVTAYCGAALLRVVDMLAGEQPGMNLHLAWQAPPDALLERDVIADRLVFDARTSFIHVPTHILDVPCRFPDPVAYRMALSELRRALEREGTPSSVTEFVSRAIERAPGSSSLSRVAEAMGMSVSTLKRRLEAEGTTFREVRESVLRERAIVLLLDPALPMSQIAVDLGYSDLANFHHAFKRWTRRSPGEFRRAGIRPRSGARLTVPPTRVDQPDNGVAVPAIE